MKAFTSIEQSKKLAEILPLESADMRYERVCFDRPPEKCWYIKLNPPFKSDDIIPCWSLATLMNMLPSEFTTENKFGKYKYEINIRKYKLTDNADIYQIAYGNYHWHEDGSCSWSDMINSGQKEELIDAVFQMVIWLKENNKL